MREERYTTQDQSIDAFLVHRFLLHSIPTIVSECQDHDDGRFYLKHVDEKGDHILMDNDNDCNITGIIDWEWAHMTSKSVAFNSPVLLLPVAYFYKGENRLGEQELSFAESLEDKGRADLADIVRAGRILHLFELCCGYDLADSHGFLGLFHGLRRALGADDNDDDAQGDWECWKSRALERYRDDDRLKELFIRYQTR